MILRFNPLFISFLILGGSVSALAQPVLVKSEQKIEEYRLDNGFRVILAPNEKENKVYMNTVYLTGSLNDPSGKSGLAHLLEHLAFKGTVNVQGEEFQRRLDQFTLSNNASTDFYATKYINIIRPEQSAINELIHLEAERMDKLVLQEKFVPAEIDIVKREREVRMDQPFAVLMNQVWQSAYGNQYFGRLPIGELNELQSINMQELNHFYKTWYAPNNAVMIIAGKFNKAEVLKEVEQQFSSIPSRSIPAQVNVPQLDAAKIKNRQFTVQKGSDLAKFNVYLNGTNSSIKTSLAVSPLLYTLQPSGHLYQNMVETGVATNVFSSTYLDKDFNMLFMGAVYGPNHNAKDVENALIAGVEKNQNFNLTELNRVKSLIKNAQDSMFVNSSAVGAMLSDYVVSEKGNWAKYFEHQQDLQHLTVDQVNQSLKSFVKPEYRIEGSILPTPEDQKKALQQQVIEQKPTLDQNNDQPEPLKDISTYQNEIAQNLIISKAYLENTEKKIQRGKLKNGMQYALFPVHTRDDKVYASIQVDFGTAESLFNKAEVIDLTAYLLLRASHQYSLQDIADKMIDSNGSASVSANDNGMNIEIVAKEDKFDDFFKFIISVLKNPKFEQTQFDLIKSQILSSLDRPYTEPETVAGLTMSRIVEKYQAGDLRYHFEPDLALEQLNNATNDQVKQLYKQFFAMNNAQIAITGNFDANKMKKILNKAFGSWRSHEKYAQLDSSYQAYPAQQIHALAEQREFGSYISLLTFPIGADNPDAPAMIVLGNILGDSQLSSRLAKELREKNALVYGFGSSINLSESQESGALGINARYTAGKSAQVSQSVHKVFKELLDNGVTEQEVAAAKADIMKKRVTALEDERRIHRMLLPQLKYNKDLYYREKRDQDYAKLSKADIDAVIKKYIKLDGLVEVMADQYGQPQS
ncbi:peptidase M16 [Acinetobacter sp. ANC 4558]|uniref:M16 family metallopeptidase n=1 Tax=Acinetobacter sp. ANC 4558 TaxID=1977876 RepID=UPI000A336DCD|nr:pitrilysin family protein [Acinetobacter sp. ANC 4558]OTG86352.1 peptidase M16 [Acinetobacter sp. ANC 4558]